MYPLRHTSPGTRRRSLSYSPGKARSTLAWDASFMRPSRSSVQRSISALKFSIPSSIALYWKSSILRMESNELNQTTYTQPALFAFEYALAEMWRSWGIEPYAVLGHSVGEYVAACIAGVFSLEDGLRLIAERARLMGALPQNGTMAAVFADAPRVADVLKPYQDLVSIAATNGPENTVISGERSAVQAVLDELTKLGISSKPLTFPMRSIHRSWIRSWMTSNHLRAGSNSTLLASPLISNLTGDYSHA